MTRSESQSHKRQYASNKHLLHKPGFNFNKFDRKDGISKIYGMRSIRIIVSFLLCLLLFIPASKAQIETTNQDNLYYLKLANGANAVLMPLPTADKTEITLSVVAGSSFENDTMNGVAYVVQRILAAKISDYLKSNISSLNPSNTSFTASTTNERTWFKLTLSPDKISEALRLLIDNVLDTVVSEQEVRGAIDSILKETEIADQNPRAVFQHLLLKSVFRADVERIEPRGVPEELHKIDLDAVLGFLKKYYVPNNIILLGTGNFPVVSFIQQFEDQFKPLIRSPFDPELITKIPRFRPMLYNTEFIVEDSLSAPEFQICWQFPGSSSNQQISFSAYLLETILNDKNNFIQVKAAKMGCKKLEAHYEANIYSGIFRIIIQPDTGQVYATYKFVMKELLRLERTLVNESMMNAGKLQFARAYEWEKRTKAYPEKIVAHWAYKDESYYRIVKDSIMDIKEKKFRQFVIEYLNLGPHVSGLLISKAERQRLQLDTVFTDLNDSVKDYVFKYLQNVTDLEGTENLVMQRNLLQWLLTNKDINIQVNGFADKREFNKVRDKSLTQFFDSIPTFSRVSSEIIRTGTLRPETMRALKIVRYLYENGIEAERLSGTSMTFSSETDEEAIANAKCTVTLDKMHETRPLREYYFGKRKE
jgi:predicted Zn-dependent peptidase